MLSKEYIKFFSFLKWISRDESTLGKHRQRITPAYLCKAIWSLCSFVWVSNWCLDLFCNNQMNYKIHVLRWQKVIKCLHLSYKCIQCGYNSSIVFASVGFLFFLLMNSGNWLIETTKIYNWEIHIEVWQTMKSWSNQPAHSNHMQYTISSLFLHSHHISEWLMPKRLI